MRDLAGNTAEAEFRYIVVGGGSAGCLVARRLAEGQAGPVALIEAGSASSDVRTVAPNYYPRLFGSSLDWNFTTEPQSGLGGRRVAWPRGKTLGGSGAINAMIFLQAANEDFQRWGWHWAIEQVAQEQIEQEQVFREQVFREQCSLLPNQPLASPHLWSEAFVRAGEEAGLRSVACLDRSQANVCGLFSVAQESGRRTHTGQGLDAVENLTVFTSCQVERVCIEADRAVGVVVRDAQVQRRLLASDEVVLCSGSIGSPLLLMASGIGSEAELQQLGIPCRLPLQAVGANLQDHLVFPLVYQTSAPVGLPRRHDRQAREQFRRWGTGSLASNIAEAGALLGSEDSDGSEFQIHFTPTHYLKYPRSPTDDDHLSLAVTDLHPRSRGRLSAERIADNCLVPRIDPAYLSVDADMERMLAAIAWARRIAEQASLRELIKQEVLPGANRQNAKSLSRVIVAYARSIYHPVGTCRMATPSDANAAHTVVDGEFRVQGIGALRVADASVLPDLPSGNTNAVTLLLAARAAELALSEK